MFQRLSLVVVLLTFGHLATAQLPFPGRCPEVKVMSTFDLDAYMNIWYEYAKYPFVFELGKKCVYARYENLGNNTVSVLNAAVSRFTESPSDIKGYAKVLGPARLAVVFYDNQNTDRANYLVLGTDYNNYAVVYSCTDIGNILHTQIVWILTRERNPSSDVIETAKKIIDDNNLSQRYLVKTIQDDCPATDSNTDKLPTHIKLGSNAIDKA